MLFRSRAGKPVGLEEFFAASSKSDEIFPAEKPVARVVVDHRASPPTQTYFLADGAPCNMHGTPLSALFADAPFLVKDVDAFFKAGLPAYFKHRIKVAPSDAARAKMTPEPGLAKELAPYVHRKQPQAIETKDLTDAERQAMSETVREVEKVLAEHQHAKRAPERTPTAPRPERVQ